MKLSAFSLFDAKVGVFSQPFFAMHRGQALRTIQEVTMDLNTTVGRHPADFILFEIGVFDDATGSMESIAPVSLGPCTQFVEKQESFPFPAAEGYPVQSFKQ